MLRVFGLLYLLIISSTYALDCGEKESWDLRLDQGNGPFSDGKVYHQGGTGTCYAQSLALNLKAQLKDRQDISAFHLAAFKADSPNSFFENFFSSNNKKHVYLKNNELISSIDAGEFCETFEKAKKMQESGICPQSKSVLENSFNFVSSETARSDLAQLSLFFDEISEKKLKVSDLKENLSGFLNPLLDSTSCRERIFGEAISASKLLIYVRGVFNKKLKTDIENNAKYKKRLDNLNSERFYNKFNGKQIKDIDPAYVYDKLVELDIVKKEEQDKDKFVADFRPLFDIYKLNEDSTCRKERSRNRIASIENSGCFKKYNGASASISKAVGALNNLYQDIGKVVLHLDFENKKFPDYFMSLISECSKNDRVSIPDKLKCEKVKFENKGHDRTEFRKTILTRISRGLPIDINYCTKFYKEPNFKLRDINEDLDLNKCTTSDNHALHASAVIGFKCDKGKAHYLVQNSWGKDWPWNNEVKFRDDRSEKSTGKVWVDEETLLGNLIQYNYLYSN